MSKVDFKKELKHLYRPSAKKIAVVDVPPMQFLMVEAAVKLVEKKKDLPALPKVRLETYQEGLSVQVLHIGAYDDEGPIIAKMHKEFIPENGYEETGKHHEIYLSDPRRVTPEKLKTVLRQPIRKIK